MRRANWLLIRLPCPLALAGHREPRGDKRLAGAVLLRDTVLLRNAALPKGAAPPRGGEPLMGRLSPGTAAVPWGIAHPAGPRGRAGCWPSCRHSPPASTP